MKPTLMRPLQRDEDSSAIRAALVEQAGYQEGARAATVNRTHRVVREQAMRMQERRKVSRALWIPLTICSTLLLVACYGFWGVLDGGDLAANGASEGSDQIMILLLWLLPVTALVLGLVWFRRGRGLLGGNNEAQQ